MAFSERVDRLRDRVDATLDAWLPPGHAEPSRLHEALRYTVFNGGKRLRPLLAYASAEAIGVWETRVDAIAAAVELVHCYSLVHDDLPAMDDDDLRRGQPTVHKAFDDATAILAGDALQTLAFEGLLKSGCHVQAIALLAEATGSRGMVGGQAMDLAFETTQPERDSLRRMFARKTGALIRAAVVMPLADGRSPDDPARAALEEYAESIGLAFQIVDDLLDIEGTTETIGKPAGSDLERGKATWPAMVGPATARADAEDLFQRAIGALERLPGDPGGLRWLADRIVRRSA